MILNELRESIVMQDDITVPAMANLLNLDDGIELLLSHLNDEGVLGVHFDVDLDGFASGIVAYRSLKEFTTHVHITTNKEREHGPTKELQEFVWKNRISLVIIVDAGSNLNYDLGCDVLILDHHEIHSESKRELNGHKQVIVSCQDLENVEPMSGCEVVYEFFRHFYAKVGAELDTSLAQWVGISLISDVIDTKTARNQFYVREAFENSVPVNADVRRICTDIDAYYLGMYRSYVTYKLAPYINGIARAGYSERLAYVISDNEPPKLPEDAIAQRDAICKESILRSRRIGNLIFSNMSGVSDAWRYSGLAAAKLSNETNCSAVVFCEEADGLVRGSFRKGTSDGEFLKEAQKYLNADGHNQAFGFRKSEKGGLRQFLIELSNWPKGEPLMQLSSKDITCGKDLMLVAYWNNRVNSQDELFIHIKPEELSFIRSSGKISYYKWRDFTVKLLSQEFPNPTRLYVENQRGITLYLK